MLLSSSKIKDEKLMPINAAKELSALESGLFVLKGELAKAKQSYEKFILESSIVYRVFRLFFMGFMLSSVVGAILLIIFSRSKIALFFELLISFVVFILTFGLFAYFGNRWGFLGIAFCIPLVVFLCLKLRSWVTSYLAGSVISCENNLNTSQLKFDDASSRLLLPQIHSLMMASTKDVMTKTSATHLREDTVIEVLEKEVESGAMTKVRLADKSGVVLFYKSAINTDIEQCVLEIE